LISIEPPPYLKRHFSANLEYYIPQIILPREKCEEFPGMASLNFILPRMSNLFPAYQARVTALSNQLQAPPFAWICGNINRDLIGYIFFFSSRPNSLYNKIDILLQKQEALRKSTDIGDKLRLIEEINDLVSFKFSVSKEHPLSGKKIIYPLLGDNGFEDPLLVDFRQILK
jgi:hypothetical protein